MGFGDKFKELAKQAQDAVAEHKDQITEAVDRASVMADERTQGKYTDKIAKVGQKTGEAVEKLAAGSERDARAEPPSSGPESTDEPGGGQ
jgi:translation elongation factor EF-Ts